VALRLEPTLAMIPPLASLLCMLYYMKIMQQSPIGVPDISGPPVPAYVIFTTVFGLLVANACINWDDLIEASHVDAKERFVAFTVVQICIPQLIP